MIEAMCSHDDQVGFCTVPVQLKCCIKHEHCCLSQMQTQSVHTYLLSRKNQQQSTIFCPFTHFLPVLGRPLAADPGRLAAPADLPPLLAPAERGEGVPLLGEAPLLLILDARLDACSQTTTCNCVKLKPVLCAVLAVHHSVLHSK